MGGGPQADTPALHAAAEHAARATDMRNERCCSPLLGPCHRGLCEVAIGQRYAQYGGAALEGDECELAAVR